MRIRALALLCCMASLGSVLVRANAPVGFDVDIAASNAELRDHGARVTLAVRALGGATGPARLRVTLIDENDVSLASGEAAITLTTRFGRVTVDVTGTKITSGWTVDSVQATRLKYEIGASDAMASQSTGVVALSRINAEAFKVALLTKERARPGITHSVLVAVTSLGTAQPVHGASVLVSMTLDADEDAVFERTVRTDRRGTANVDFPIPDLPGLDGGTIEITARRGAITSSATADLDLGTGGRALLISTDKRLYQPGQTLHTRILVVGSDRRVARAQDVKLEVEDESGETVFARTLTTSRFGVAAVDIPLADDAPLGDYTVEAVIDNEVGDNDEARSTVIVSRYELPTFTVRVASDRSFYLPGEHAKVTVSTRYLFGQPVPGGRVRIHAMDERSWNGRNEDADDGKALVEGTCGPDGAFEAHLDLTAAMDELYQSRWRSYQDAPFVASVTDPTTNRTERRRFDLRTTREPIHVTVAGQSQVLPGHPTSFFVTTTLADGTVLPCDVIVSEAGPRAAGPDGSSQLAWLPIARVRTNRYGVARVRNVRMQSEVTTSWGGREIRIEATAEGGRSGSTVESFSDSEDAVVTVEPTRSVLSVGDPLEATVRTSTSASVLMIAVLRDGAVLDTASIPARSGRATIRLPYRPEFRGRVSVAAYDPTVPLNRWYSRSGLGSAGVLYPESDRIEVRVRPERDTYSPGESMSAAVRVSGESGRRTESVLAVAAVDASVAERYDSTGRFSSGGLTGRVPWAPDDGGRIGDVTLSSIERARRTRPISDDLDLVAATLLSGGDPNVQAIEVVASRTSRLDDVFRSAIYRLRGTIDVVLIEQDRSQRGVPADRESLAEALACSGVDFDRLVDPWGTKLVAESRIDGPIRTLRVSSAGPDTVPGTFDDVFITQRQGEYFKPMGARVAAAIDAYTFTTGRFVRDDAAFRSALQAAGIDPAGLRDIWGRSYAPRFSASGTFLSVALESAGPDGRFGPDRDGESDDFVVSRAFTDFYAQKVYALQTALDGAARRGAYPVDEASWRSALLTAGIDPGTLADQFDSQPEPKFARLSRYTDRVSFIKSSVFGSSTPTIRTQTTPVTEEFDEIRLVGRGPDRTPATLDDVVLARFVHVRSTTAAGEPAPAAPVHITPVASGIGGSISGTVTDPQGAVIGGAVVRLLDSARGVLREIVTAGDGSYFFDNLTPARYTIQVEGAGFVSATIDLVPVYAQTTTRLDVELNIGGAAEMVEVTAGSEGIVVNTESQTLATTVTQREVRDLPLPQRRERKSAEPERGTGPVSSTPRLRQYFPETVYWNPELVTDKSGRARIEFPLADSITTWQLSVLASTEDGRVAFGSADVLAYQPFFVEHDPPRVLTEGDRIGLPVIVRNYLDEAQSVDLSIAPAPWFAIEGLPNRTIRVEAGSSSRQIFGVKTIASVDDGPQRVTGLGERASDAIEKPVDVHPDGEERIATSTALFSGTGTLDLGIPVDVLGSPQTKLKIYPSLMAHVVESVEGIMERPHGCGEQTISSTYPSVLLLKHASDGVDSALEAKAARYVREGYERLKSYRADDGGIGYWSDSPSNTALTAYALQFLLDAGGVIEIDVEFVDGLRDCLLASQRADGGWEAPRWYSSGDRVRDAMETAYVAGVLARLQAIPSRGNARTGDAVARALAFAAPIATGVDEPYLIASIALVAMDTGNQAMADDAMARLIATAHTEGAASYWALETNTPFCGWGLAGRVETTARVVRALARRAKRQPAGAISDEAGRLADRGTSFLLKQKDRYGVWYSTQATVAVLDALLEQLGDDTVSATATRSAAVRVDGRDLASIALPVLGVVSEPLSVDLSASVGAGRHRVEVVSSDGSKLFVQIVARHYVPWVDAGRDASKPNRAEKRADALRFAVEYDRLDAAVGQPVTCTVTAERIGHRGYGMLVAEIGLPPGNDVDRASLDRAVSNSRWTVCRYDVLPDRVVVYLWPWAGGVTFSFGFTTRYGVEAMAAPSSVYDYYNPESSVVLQPPRFVSVE